MIIRYEDMKVDRALLQEYAKEMKKALDSIRGQDDIIVLVKNFEKEFADYIERKFAVAVNSGTDGLCLCLAVLNIGAGDEVIMPNVTYPAVPLAVTYRKARPVFVDIDEDSLSMDTKKIEKAITKKTKAVIAAHMFARPCDIKKILDIAKKYKLKVIEDTCQAESSTYAGRKLGSFGDFGCFSFSYYKPLSSCGGGGGAVLFDNERYKDIYKYTQIWRDEKLHLDAGMRFAPIYLLDLIAVKVKFRYLQVIIKSRLKIKQIYEDELSKVRAIKIFKDQPNTNSVPQNFVILSDRRDALNDYLKKNNVISQEPYKPLHITKLFGALSGKCKFPVSDIYWNRALHLPLYSFMPEEECLYVAGLIKKFYS